MHFLVFMFLFVMMALSLIGALCLMVSAYEDSEKGLWIWVPGDVFFSLTCGAIFLYFLELFIKFINA